MVEACTVESRTDMLVRISGTEVIVEGGMSCEQCSTFKPAIDQQPLDIYMRANFRVICLCRISRYLARVFRKYTVEDGGRE